MKMFLVDFILQQRPAKHQRRKQLPKKGKPGETMDPGSEMPGTRKGGGHIETEVILQTTGTTNTSSKKKRDMIKTVENHVQQSLHEIEKMSRIKVIVVDISISTLRSIAAMWSSATQDISSILSLSKKNKAPLLELKDFLVANQQDALVIAFSEPDQDYVYIQCKKS